jgi:hypothetical protein
MKRKILISIFMVVMSLILVTGIRAQGEGVKLSLSRDWGYGGGRDIQGLFSMKVTASVNIEHIGFFIDDNLIFDDAKAPYKVQFTTNDYPLGEHSLYAIGYTIDGVELKSNVIRVNFVSAGEGWKTTGKILVPIVIVILGAVVVAAVVPALSGKKTVAKALGEPRNYPLGGAICPKCNRPFALHIWGLNMMLNKLDRCPYCGRWSLVRHQQIDRLRAAEQEELIQNQASNVLGESADEKLKKELDDSKYQNR